ncbi:aspartate/glutamate racemase family protein [Periweissella ghanensis]|uniref:Aspartate racemase n=1 Tax=Periweissella ghanensis TaxID=467997 RepID=A0ABM8Z932_9LACO|nr:amino acid racemase [Periweissella ghanensis]MCM0601063.1 amino acid racemase [Periweissella ghanensis]CAH0417854.1 Aspartate racemase [Periweissella ghanensis]
MKNFFGIIGGMGTKATETFIKAINDLTPAHSDQEYLNYLVINDAQVPDRTAYILGKSTDNPLPTLLDDVTKLNACGADFAVITCNTAHYFLPQLEQAANFPILNMPQLAAQQCFNMENKQPRVGLLATNGTIEAHIYQQYIESLGGEVVLLEPAWQKMTMQFIYDDVKDNDFVDSTKYHTLINRLLIDAHCDYVILGCTELSVAQAREPYPSEFVIDAQAVLAQTAVTRALANRHSTQPLHN